MTEEQGPETVEQQQRHRPLLRKQQRSAAQHTYDHSSQRWEHFDADAAMHSSDDSDGERPSAAALKAAMGRRSGGAGAQTAAAASSSPPTPSAQPVLPPQRRAAKRPGAAEAGSGEHFCRSTELVNAEILHARHAGGGDVHHNRDTLVRSVRTGDRTAHRKC